MLSANEQRNLYLSASVFSTFFSTLLCLLLRTTLVFGATPDSFKTPEFYNGGGLDVINIAQAYALGYTGKGITLGIIDEGIRTEHFELANKAMGVPSFLPSGEIYTPDWIIDAHGTYVAGIMAARRDGLGRHGVAFDANLLGVIHLPEYAYNKNIYEVYSQRPDVRIINNSWVLSNFVYYATEGDIDTRANILSLAKTYHSLAPVTQLALDHQDKVIVFAAGNDGIASPDLAAVLPRYLGAKARNWISATALNPRNVSRDQNGHLTLSLGAVSSFTCLSFGAELWSVMAPGTGINGLYSGDKFGYQRLSGTSAATPHVSSALGLVQQAFPWMQGRQLADAVLTTANNTFDLPKAVVRIQYGYIDNLAITNFGDTFGPWEPSKEELKALVYEAYVNDPDDLQQGYLFANEDEPPPLEVSLDAIDKGWYHTFTLTREQVFGQGILDVGKAVRGIARLDANRMIKDDVYDLRSILGGTTKVALETFDTKGYTSEFSNDITERKWNDRYHHPDFQTSATGPTADNDHALALQNLPVGLRKTGEGMLILSGTNTYTGATMVDGGALAISRRLDGSGGVLQNSDVLVRKAGVLTGDGNIMGTVVNSGIVSPGSVGIGVGGKTLTVGQYTQHPGATLDIAFDATSKHTTLATTNATLGGTLQLRPLKGFYADGLLLNLNPLVTGKVNGGFNSTNLVSLSPTLNFEILSAAHSGATLRQQRASDAYSRYATNSNAANVGHSLATATAIQGDMQNLFVSLDFSAPDGSEVSEGLAQLSPDAYANATLVSFDLHRMLSDLLMPSLFTRSPGAADGEWHIFVQPFAGYRDQPRNGDVGYRANNAGLMSSVERVTLGGLTLGGHIAFNYQSMTGDTNSKLRGEGLYLGAQAKYAPIDWNGWGIFGMGRVGVENWEMKREVSFAGYSQENRKEWTGTSGALRLGGSYEANFDTFKVGPFVALDYAFSVRPSLTEEDGLASRLHLDAAVSHSLRSNLGARIATQEKSFGEYAKWQGYASIVWNHELLNQAGTFQASFADTANTGFSNQIKFAERDSLGLGAGLTLTTENNISFSLNAGSEFFRSNSVSVYGNLNVGWKF